MSIPNLRHLRVFHLTLKLKSINQASQQANLSQPAVTQAISKLEDVFDAPLFDRRSVGMFPTKYGSLLGIRVERALRILRDASKQLTTAARQRNGRSSSIFERSVSVSQLRALIAISQTGSFIGAAKLLDISQPSVHRAASQLEALAEVTLFERVSQGLVLSLLGRMLARSASLVFHEIEQAYGDISAAKGEIAGRAIMGTLPLSQTDIVPHAVNELSKRFPKVSVSVMDGAYEVLVESLSNGDIDVLIGALRGSAAPQNVIEHPLFNDRLVPIARTGHPLHSRQDLTVEELVKWDWVVGREGAPGRAAFDALMQQQSISKPIGLIETGSFPVLRGLLINSDRLSLLSPLQARFEIETGLLKPLNFHLSGTDRTIGLTLRSDFAPSVLQANLISELKNAAARQQT